MADGGVTEPNPNNPSQTNVTQADIDRWRATVSENGLNRIARFETYVDMYRRTGVEQLALQAKVSSLEGFWGAHAKLDNALAMGVDPNYEIPLNEFSRQIQLAEIDFLEGRLRQGTLNTVTSFELFEVSQGKWIDFDLIANFPGSFPSAGAALLGLDFSGAWAIASDGVTISLPGTLLALGSTPAILMSQLQATLSFGYVDPLGTNTFFDFFDFTSTGYISGGNFLNQPLDYDPDALGGTFRGWLDFFRQESSLGVDDLYNQVAATDDFVPDVRWSPSYKLSLSMGGLIAGGGPLAGLSATAGPYIDIDDLILPSVNGNLVVGFPQSSAYQNRQALIASIRAALDTNRPQ